MATLPTLVAYKQGTNTGGTSNVTVSLNSGWDTDYSVSTFAAVEGDVVFAAWAVDATSDVAMSIVSSGWTALPDLYADDNFDTNLLVAYKVMGSTPDTSVIVNPTGSSSFEGAYQAFVLRPATSTTLVIEAQPAFGSNTGLPTPAAITPSAYPALVFCFASASYTTLSALTNATIEGYETLTPQGTDKVALALGFLAYSTPLASGTYTPNQWSGGSSNTGASWAAETIAIHAVDAAITGTTAGTIGLTGSTAGTVAVQGAGSGSFSLTGSTAGKVAVTAAASGTVSFTGSSAGAVKASAMASGSFGLTGSSVASAIVSGAASGTEGFTGSSTGVAPIAARGSGTIAFTGASAGGVGVAGASSGTIPLTGSSAGSLGGTAIGSASGTIDLAGAATATIQAKGVGAGSLPFTGTSTGSPVIGGIATGGILFDGTATGTASQTAHGIGAGTISFSGSAMLGAYGWRPSVIPGALILTPQEPPDELDIISPVIPQSLTLSAGPASSALTIAHPAIPAQLDWN